MQWRIGCPYRRYPLVGTMQTRNIQHRPNEKGTNLGDT